MSFKLFFLPPLKLGFDSILWNVPFISINYQTASVIIVTASTFVSFHCFALLVSMSNTSNNVSAEIWNLPLSSPQSVDDFGRFYLFFWLSRYLTWIRWLGLTTHSEENLIEKSTWNEHGSARDRCVVLVFLLALFLLLILNSLGCLIVRVCVFNFEQEEEGRSKAKGKLPNSYWGWSCVCFEWQQQIRIGAAKGPPVQRKPLKHRDYEVDLESRLGKTQVWYCQQWITKFNALMVLNECQTSMQYFVKYITTECCRSPEVPKCYHIILLFCCTDNMQTFAGCYTGCTTKSAGTCL